MHFPVLIIDTNFTSCYNKYNEDSKAVSFCSDIFIETVCCKPITVCTYIIINTTLAGDFMNNDFIVTDIQRIIFIGKDEYTEKELEFTAPLSCNELILHLSGKGMVKFNGKKLNCVENTVRFLPKGKNEEYKVFDDEKGECIDIFFNTDKPISAEAFTVNSKNGSSLKTLFKKIFSVWVAKNDGFYFECMGLLYKILAELSLESYITNEQSKIIMPAVKYIEENFLTEKISVKELAKKCEISDSYLKKLFIKRYSVPPVKYIIQMKINYACDLLLSKRYTIAQIADFCGYMNIHFFYRQFKEYTGVTPTEFQKKYISSK